MKKLLILLLAALVTTAFSCSDFARLERKEDRLIGAWAFDKAFYRSDWQVFRKDVFDEFRGDIIEFYGDYSAIYDDASQRIVYDGEWGLFFERDYFEDDSDIEFYLDMHFWDDLTGESFAYFTAVNWLTQNKLNVRARTRDGVYTFKLRKI
jgi:hypothetical protein